MITSEDFTTLWHFQGYRKRYNINYRSSGSCNFCEINKVSDFGTSDLLKLSQNLNLLFFDQGTFFKSQMLFFLWPQSIILRLDFDPIM